LKGSSVTAAAAPFRVNLADVTLGKVEKYQVLLERCFDVSPENAAALLTS
jgi:hypothetical protein